MKKKRGLILILCLSSIMLSAVAYSKTEVSMDAFSDVDLKEEAWGVYLNSKWDNLANSAYKKSDNYYTTIKGINMEEWASVTGAVHRKSGEWYNKEYETNTEIKYLLIAISKAFRDKIGEVEEPDEETATEKEKKEYYYDQKDVCCVRTFIQPNYMLKGTTDEEMKFDSVRILNNKVLRLRDAYNRAGGSGYHVDLYDTNADFDIFIQSLIYDGYYSYMFNAEKEYSEANAKEYRKNYPDKIKYEYDDFAKTVRKYYKSLRINAAD